MRARTRSPSRTHRPPNPTERSAPPSTLKTSMLTGPGPALSGRAWCLEAVMHNAQADTVVCGHFGVVTVPPNGVAFHPGSDQQSIICWTSPYSRRSRSMCCSRPPITVPHRCTSIMTEPSCSRQAFLEWATPSSSPELSSLSRGIRWIERSPRSPSTSIPFWSTRRCRGVRPFRSRRRLGEGVRLCSGRAETSE